MLKILNPDNVQDIFSFLTQEEAAKLRTTCKLFNVTATSNIICMPFLNRLKALDNRVCVLAPKAKNERWCYERFVNECTRIAQEQQEEIQHFLEEVNKLPQIETIQQEIAQLQTLKDNKKISLAILEQRHLILERLNAALIISRIDVNKTKLDLSRLSLTRFSESLFTKAEYQHYWQSLQKIDCGFNKLKIFPQSISHCRALQTLYCDNNQLQTLPNSLGNCPALQELFCGNNHLQALPDSLGNCKKLWRLNCSNNNLQTLPTSLSKCKALKEIYCSSNQLKALPDSLGNCNALKELLCDNNYLLFLPATLSNSTTLTRLSCKKNYLTEIPEAVINQMGKNWHRKTIADQKYHFFKTFGNKIPLLPPKSGKWSRDYIHSEALRIFHLQEEEILHFLAHASELPRIDSVQQNVAQLKALHDAADKNNIMAALTQRHLILEQLNVDLIVSCIDVNNTNLEISNLCLTRFSESLFTKAEYQHYWQTLQSIDCSDNHLKALPKFLRNCPALQKLYCDNNDLSALPRSLRHCKHLEILICGQNYLIDIPEDLINKLGKSWQNEMLSNQKCSIPFEKPKISPANQKAFWYQLAATLVGFMFTSFMIAFGEGLLLAGLLLKAGIILPTTQAALIAASLAISFFATTAVVGLFYCLNLTHQKHFETQNQACDKLLAQLAAQFTTPTGQAFIQSLQTMENQAPQPLQFKQFEVKAYKKVAPLSGPERERVKKEILAQATRQFATAGR